MIKVARPMNDGDSYDIAIRESLFIANEAAKKEFEDKFIPAYQKMKKLFAELQATKGFKGKAKEGFMETFEILLRYHEDLNKKIPDLYATIEALDGNLDAIKNEAIYKSLKG